MDIEMIEGLFEDIKNFVLGSIIFLSSYLALNYILYVIEKYIN